MSSPLKMIVGLGNPGRNYANNRHNIGFRAVELYAERYGIEVTKKQSKALVGQGWRETREAPPALKTRVETAGSDKVADSGETNRDTATANQTRQAKVLLVKPQTFMNNSGEAVAALAGYYNVNPADILVIHDDMDLPAGKLRIRPGGGAGGQNGVRSIINRLSTQDFPRLRIGIDRPPGRMDPAAYVLQDFQKKEAELFGDLAGMVVKIIDRWVFDGIDRSMNEFNGRT